MLICIFKCSGCELRIQIPSDEVLESEDEQEEQWCFVCAEIRMFIFEKVFEKRVREIVLRPALFNDVPD
ncbi:MAG: hypothetical protein WAP52_02290 [Candidatus Sungiibacteriota bacterium]